MTMDQIIEGAVDMHVHTYPEFNENFISARDDFENIKAAQGSRHERDYLKVPYFSDLR